MTVATPVIDYLEERDDRLPSHKAQALSNRPPQREPMRVSRSLFASPGQYLTRTSFGGRSLGGFLSGRNSSS